VRLLRPAATLAALALAWSFAQPASASWSAARALTASGTAGLPVVGLSGPDRIAALYVRSLHGERRVELRRGTEDRLGPAIVLERSRRTRLGSPALHVDRDRALAVWARIGAGLAAASVLFARGPNDPRSLTGRSAVFEPRFVAPDLLTWHGLRQGYVRERDGGTFGVTTRLPEGASFGVALAVAPDGTLVAVWPQGGRILAAQRPAGGTFGPPVRLSGAGYARAPVLTVTASGAVVAAWVQSAGEGNALVVSARPSSGAFGAARELAPASEGAVSPHALATSDGAVVLTYVASRARVGWAVRRGPLRALRVGPDGAPRGRTLTLTPDDETTQDAALAADGSAAWVAWAGSRAGRDPLRVRRLAAIGVPGRLRTLSGDDDVAAQAPAFAMTRSSRALLGYSRRDGRLRYVWRSPGLEG
jgi:hypothetical protein